MESIVRRRRGRSAESTATARSAAEPWDVRGTGATCAVSGLDDDRWPRAARKSASAPASGDPGLACRRSRAMRDIARSGGRRHGAIKPHAAGGAASAGTSNEQGGPDPRAAVEWSHAGSTGTIPSQDADRALHQRRQPVVRCALSRHSGLELSPATIRTDGGLGSWGHHQPHTRRPRPRLKGYRFSSTADGGSPSSRPRFIGSEGELPDRPQQLVSAAAGLLSQLHPFRGVVMTRSGARRRSATSNSCGVPSAACCSSCRHDRGRRAEPHPAHGARLHGHRSSWRRPTLHRISRAAVRHEFAAGSRRAARVARMDIAGLMSVGRGCGEGALAQGESLVVTGAQSLHAEDLDRTWNACGACSTMFDQKTCDLHLLRRVYFAALAQGVTESTSRESASCSDECSVVDGANEARPGQWARSA